MTRAISWALPALALAGCGGVAENNVAAGNEGAARAVTLQPGLWEHRSEVADISETAGLPEIPGQTTRACLTPEQAANPSAGPLGGGSQNPPGCTTESSFADGRISAATTCNLTGGSIRTTINGRFTPTTYELTLRSRREVRGEAIDTSVRVTGRRIGECPPGGAPQG